MNHLYFHYSYNPNEHERAAAAVKLATVPNYQGLYSLLELVCDRSPIVRAAATQGLERWLVPERFEEILRHLVPIYHLNKKTVTHHRALLAQFSAFLTRPEYLPILMSRVVSDFDWQSQRKNVQVIVEILIQSQFEQRLTVLKMCMTHQDALLRQRVAKYWVLLSESEWLVLFPILAQRESIPLLGIRALQITVRRFPQHAPHFAQLLLWHRVKRIAEYARNYLQSHGYNVEDLALKAIHQPKSITQLGAALVHLGQINAAAHVELFKYYFTDSHPRVQVVALQGLVAGLGISAAPYCYKALSSPHLKVAMNAAYCCRQLNLPLTSSVILPLVMSTTFARMQLLSRLVSYQPLWEQLIILLHCRNRPDADHYLSNSVIHKHLKQWLRTYQLDNSAPTSEQVQQLKVLQAQTQTKEGSYYRYEAVLKRVADIIQGLT